MCDVMKELIQDNRVDDIRKMMKNLKLTAKQAMDALEIPASEQEVYIKAL